MIAVVQTPISVYWRYEVVTLSRGARVKGALAAHLLATSPDKVEPVDGDATDPDQPVPAGDTPTGTIPQILEWVGEDADRARQALEAEQARGDKARPRLVNALTGLAG